MADKYAGYRLPDLTDGSMALVDAATMLVLEGQPSELLHAGVERTGWQELGAPVPDAAVGGRLLVSRTAAIAHVVADSLLLTVLDATNQPHIYAGRGGRALTSVPDPRSYYDLLRTGRRVHQVVERARAHPKRGVHDEEPWATAPHAVSNSVFQYAHLVLGDHSLKFAMGELKTAQPKLQPGETVEDRTNRLLETREKRRYVGRYARTLGVAGAATALALSAHNQAQHLKAEGDEISIERAALEEGDVPFYSTVAAGAALRFGYWQVVRRQRPGQENN